MEVASALFISIAIGAMHPIESAASIRDIG